MNKYCRVNWGFDCPNKKEVFQSELRKRRCKRCQLDFIPFVKDEEARETLKNITEYFNMEDEE